MPRQPTVTEIRLQNIADCLAPTVAVLNELNDVFAPPFVEPISNTVVSLLMIVQNVKQNKKDCAQLLENIYQVLLAIIGLHVKSESMGSLSPVMTEHLGKFMKTLHRTYMYIEAQQDRTKLKQLFRNTTGMNNLVKDCYAELDEAKKLFEVSMYGAIFKDIMEMKKAAEVQHQALLELISKMSGASTIPDGLSPKIFYGRETELEHIMKMLGQKAPQIAILGGGGMGKTSLARAALHHQDTLARFEARFFVSAEPATTSIELAALIGLHVGLGPGQDLTTAVVRYFSKKSSGLLILDNIETVWEPIQSRGGVEEFLSLLTDIEHLGLIITMRGAERPAKTQWTHPFLLPLQPLSDSATEQTFLDITDSCHPIKDFKQLLSFTDNMPLAVDLLAHLVDYEGLENVLARWETEKTTMLSVGHDRKSNLDASISLSLSSPRITSDSKKLLSLLSVLPNGLSDAELMQSNLPISNILSSKAILLATSLAYQTSNKRLLVLMPVREHIQLFLPPSFSLIHSLRKHFYALLKLYQKFGDGQLKPVISQITANLGNLQEVLQRGLYTGNPNLADTIYCVIALNSFCRVTGRGMVPLIQHIQNILPKTDRQLEIQFIIEVLKSSTYYLGVWMDELVIQGIDHFQHINDPLLESKFYCAASVFAQFKLDQHALEFINKAKELSKLSGDHA
ncbi:hypothetical protein C8R45DRAFT_1084598, partial [Mycena sanguinolenta]